MRKEQGFTLIELMIVVAIIGILAAIAIPAYENYIAKAQASEAVSLIDGLKTPVTTYMTQNGACPTNGQGSVPATVKGKYVNSVTTQGTYGTTGACTIIATFKGTGVSSGLQNGTVTFTADNSNGDITWTCTSNIKQKYLPSSCTGAS